MPPKNSERNDSKQTNRRNEASQSIFAVPAPIKQLFDKFPLITYPGNDLPQRAPSTRNAHTLYVFTTEAGVISGAPSYNPACLKWQTYLKFSNIEFRIASSNNHASPSGALPFLLPSSTDTSKPVQPIPSGKLQRWGMNNSPEAIEEPSDMRYEAYLSLVDHRIRRAWLYSVYLSYNRTSIAEPSYILPTSSNPFVRLSISKELKNAAEKELLKFSDTINADVLYSQAEEALAALEVALGKDTWFFGASKPGVFDASVFAYSHLLMDENFGKGWVDTRLRDALLSHQNLTAHRNRILGSYFPEHV